MGFETGDTVFYYARPGQVKSTLVHNRHLNRHGGEVYSLLGVEFLIGIGDLYSTQEEAATGLSLESKRFMECLKEAMRVYGLVFPTPVDIVAEEANHIWEMAFKLFDIGGE